MDQSTIGHDTVIKLTALNIAQASANLALITSTLANHEQLVLDLSACDEVDTAGLQLLAAIRLDPAYQNRVDWTGCTKDFQAKAQRLGLSDLLTCAKRGSHEH